MNSTAPLSGSHLGTYDKIFQHPLSHNLEWRAVHSLLASIGEVVEQPNGNLRVTRNGHVLVLHPPRTKDVAEAEEVLSLRHFLEKSEVVIPMRGEGEARWLLVIDHHEARIFGSGADGASPQRILPPEPEAYFRHARHSKDFSRGQEKPDPTSFFEPVVKSMQAGGPILIFGSGTGMSSEMDQFNSWLKIHNPEMAKRVAGTVVVDEHHMTDAQLLARARNFFNPQGRS
jgi:hypothetical protein